MNIADICHRTDSFVLERVWNVSSRLDLRAIVLQVSKQDALDLQTLTAYITYARQHINPTLSDEAADDLINGYVEMRQKGNFPGSSKKVCALMLT